MTDTAVETPVEQPAAALAVRDPELDRLARLGRWLALAESKSDAPEAKGAGAALRLYYADQLELPPLAAAELSLIGGRLVMSAKLLRALAARAGYRVVRVDVDDHACTAALIREDTGEELGRTTFTMEQAKKAGLVRDRSAWVTHPARMLWARASKFVIDDHAPDVSLGIATEDEVEEFQGSVAGASAAPATDTAASDSTPGEVVEEAEWTEEPVAGASTSAPASDLAGGTESSPTEDQGTLPPAGRKATRQQHARLGAIIRDLEAKWPTRGEAEPWEDWTRSRARELFQVDSRAELDYDQMGKLIDQATSALEQGDQARIPF